MSGLTEKQEAFAQHYARHRSGAAAYVAAYNARNCSPSTITEESKRCLRHPGIALRIRELTEAVVITADVTLEAADFFKKLCLIATADPRELTAFKAGNCRHCNGEDFGYRWRTIEEFQEAFGVWQDLATKGVKAPMPDISGGVGWRPFHPANPDCPECGGGGTPHPIFKPSDEYGESAAALFAGVEVTRNGTKIHMHDQLKAAEMAVRMLGAFDDKLELKGQLAATIKAAVAVASDQKSAAEMYAAMMKG